MSILGKRHKASRPYNSYQNYGKSQSNVGRSQEESHKATGYKRHGNIDYDMKVQGAGFRP